MSSLGQRSAFWSMFLPPPEVIILLALKELAGFNQGLRLARDAYEPEPFDVLTEMHAGAVAFRSALA